MNDGPVSLTLLERVRTQAEVLVPLIKRLETELGEERAHSLAREVLSSYFRSTADQYVRESEGDPVQAFVRFAADSTAGDAIETEPIEGAPGQVNFDVTDCKYAKFFKSLGEPELGFLLVCSMDFDVADVLGIGLQRTTTIMQGADRCDFRWHLP
jgi:predicted ArsR family transcriptional regulator